MTTLVIIYLIIVGFFSIISVYNAFKKKKECKHKWKYIGRYNGGYYNHKECIHCNKLEIERSKLKPKVNDNIK